MKTSIALFALTIIALAIIGCAGTAVAVDHLTQKLQMIKYFCFKTIIQATVNFPGK